MMNRSLYFRLSIFHYVCKFISYLTKLCIPQGNESPPRKIYLWFMSNGLFIQYQLWTRVLLCFLPLWIPSALYRKGDHFPWHCSGPHDMQQTVTWVPVCGPASWFSLCLHYCSFLTYPQIQMLQLSSSSFFPKLCGFYHLPFLLKKNKTTHFVNTLTS